MALTCTERILLTLQLIIFVIGRMLDDMSWYDVGIQNQVNIFEGFGVAGMSTCVILQIIRKKHIQGIFKIMFVRSQLKFLMPWALVTKILFLFFHIFGCGSHLPQQNSDFYILIDGCWLNAIQILLTNLNYALICNTKAHIVQLCVYQLTLFVEIVYNGNLLMVFVSKLLEKPKDRAILFISLIIANQILVMDMMFRAAYQDREREEEKEEKMLGHIHTSRKYSMSEDISNIKIQNNLITLMRQTPLKTLK